MMKSAKIGLIGAGEHSRAHHLPALAECVRLDPEEVELAAICDLDMERAQLAARDYGFSRSYRKIEDMLGMESLDGFIAVSLVEKTAAMAHLLLQARCPLLIEKPPACSLEEVEALESKRAEADVPIMVSMNRRHEASIRRYLRCPAP